MKIYQFLFAMLIALLAGMTFMVLSEAGRSTHQVIECLRIKTDSVSNTADITTIDSVLADQFISR